MRAIQVATAGSAKLVEVTDPESVGDDIVVEVVTASICATDRKLTARGFTEPRIPGHEVTGRLPDGALVGIHPEISCGVCQFCRAGWDNRCADRLALGIGRDGGLAERLVVPRDRLIPLQGLAPETGAMLEPLACVVHAIAVTEINRGVPTLVVGGGVMGILAAWTLAAMDCPVALAQRSAGRRELAAKLGIAPVAKNAAEAVDALGTSPEFVMVTAPGAEPLRDALDVVAVGGLVHAFAGTPGGADIDANTIHYRHLRLLGSTGSRLSDYARARDLAVQGAVPLASLPHEVVSLSTVVDRLSGSPQSAGALKTVVRIGDGV